MVFKFKSFYFAGCCNNTFLCHHNDGAGIVCFIQSIRHKARLTTWWCSITRLKFGPTSVTSLKASGMHPHWHIYVNLYQSTILVWHNIYFIASNAVGQQALLHGWTLTLTSFWGWVKLHITIIFGDKVDKEMILDWAMNITLLT